MRSISKISFEPYGSEGSILLSTCPGLGGFSKGNADNNQSARDELRELKTAGVDSIVSLLEAHELIKIGVQDLPENIFNQSLLHDWFPILDRAIPKDDELEILKALLLSVIDRLKNGETVMVHCYAGLGRSGMFAALLLVEHGMPASNAIKLVREKRRGAIENMLQEQFIIDWK